MMQYLADVSTGLNALNIGHTFEDVGGDDTVLLVDNPDGSVSALSEDYVLGVYPNRESWELSDQLDDFFEDMYVEDAVRQIARRHNG